MLVRTVTCLEGEVEVELVCEPAFDYGRAPGEWTLVRQPPHCGRHRRRPDDPPAHRSRARDRGQPGPCPAHAREPAIGVRRAFMGGRAARARRCRRRHRAAGRHGPVLAYAGWRAPRGFPTIAGARRSSARRWRSRDSRTCRPGRLVAALTTSLPETPGGERNWDYRYTWMRDSTFTLQALHLLGLDWEADEFMQFVADIEPNERRRRCRSCTGSTGGAT